MMQSAVQKRAEYRALFKRNVRGRLVIDKIAMGIVLSCVVIAIIPLGSILLEVFKNGIAGIQRTKSVVVASIKVKIKPPLGSLDIDAFLKSLAEDSELHQILRF